MAGKGVVAGVVGRHGHDGPRAVSRQHVIADIDGQLRTVERVDRIGTGKGTADPFGIGHTFAFGTFLGLFDIGFDRLPLPLGSQLPDQLVLGRDHHERGTEDRIGPRGEYLQLPVASLDSEKELRSRAASDPVALYLLERLTPVEVFHPFQKTFGVGAHPQQPLLHALLHHRETAAHREPIHHLVVGKHRSQPLAPVHRRIGPVGEPVVEQHLLAPFVVHRVPLGRRKTEPFGTGGAYALRTLLRKRPDQFVNGTRPLLFEVVITVVHLQERPLGPTVVGRIAGDHLTVPVVRKTEFVELFAITRHVLGRSDGRMLTGLYGILFRGQTERIESHRMQHVEPAEPFVARVDIRGDIPQRMPHMQPRPGGIGKHVEDVVLGTRRVDVHLIGFAPLPLLLPARLYLTEIIFHNSFLYLFLKCKYNKYIRRTSKAPPRATSRNAGT